MATQTSTAPKAPAKRLLPIGIQDFPKIRENGCVYVDKTPQIYRLISGTPGAFFLSRPRRFGKSLLCSTLGAIFEGRRELFGEIAGRPALAMDTLDWEWKRHPVIRIDLNAGNYGKGTSVLDAVLQNELDNTARRYGVALRGQTVPIQFDNLIIDLNERFGEKAVVIIDEYDKPLTSTLNERDIHVQMRGILKGFYGVLKSCDAHLRLVFLTGVSKFSQVSVFSDLNQLKDMTFDPRYADLCGLTQEELEANFGPEINGILESTGSSRAEYMKKLRRFYNGYRFSEKTLTVYNPFGILNHFDNNGSFRPYWYQSATPTLLTDLINQRKLNLSAISNLRVGYEDFERLDIDNIELAPLLCQTGYLTITDYDEARQRFTLDFPNEEVSAAFAKSLVKRCMHVPPENGVALHVKLTDALYDGDVDAMLNAIKVFLAGIPYDIIPPEKEVYFQAVLHLIFKMLGFDCRPEVKIADGRIDAVVETKEFVYCFEFKLNGTAKEALAQIDDKGYAFPWTGSGKKVFKVGVSFDYEKRNIGEWVTELG
jgi:hypothetical protein